MNPIDIAFLAVMLFGVYKGFTTGLIGSVLTFFKFVVALFVALQFSHAFAAVIKKMFKVPDLVLPIVAFVLIFVVVMSLLYLLSNALEFLINAVQLGSLNRALGIVFWMFLLAFGFSTLLWLANEGKVLPNGLKATSAVYPHIQPLSDIVFCKITGVWPAVEQIIGSITNLIDRLTALALGDCASGE